MMTRDMDGIDRQIGTRIRYFRMRKKLSQEKLGDILGVTFQQIQKYEKGVNAVASTRLPALCKALDIEPNDLFERYGGRLPNAGTSK